MLRKKRKRVKIKPVKKIKKRLPAKVSARKNEIKLRKNFFPTLVLATFLWLSLAFTVYFVDPFSFGAIFIFFLLSFLALLFTSSLLFANTRRGVITAGSLTTFLVLRYFGIGHTLNFLLIAGLAIAVELYFLKS